MRKGARDTRLQAPKRQLGSLMASMQWGPEPKKGISFTLPGNREKEKGNVLFKEGKLAAALASYRSGLDAVRTDVTAHGIAARLALHLNCAAVLLKLERPHEAIESCTGALAIDARNFKALLRRAKAHVGVSAPVSPGCMHAHWPLRRSVRGCRNAPCAVAHSCPHTTGWQLESLQTRPGHGRTASA